MIDLVIIGAGPSALTAGIYAARDGLSVQIFEKEMIGGIISTSEFVENYGEVSDLEDLGESVKMKVDGEEFESRMVLIATGNSYRKLGLVRENEFIGRGIHFCATCDGAFYARKTVISVGGGNAGVQEALFRSKIKAQEILQKKLEKAVEEGKIELFLGAQIEEILVEKGDFGDKIRGVKVRRGDSEIFEIRADGIFEFVGLIPNTKFLENSQVRLNGRGEIIVDEKFQTSSKNIFASGDVVENAEKQLVIAAGSGTKAAIEISKKLHN
jgi:thioredoxin reductase (NADPH)